MSDDAKLVKMLTRLNEHCAARIEAGDLDLDGWLYESRDLSEKLISVLSRGVE